MDIDRNKVVRLIEYLSKLATLRVKIIREIKEYDNVLWLSEIPRDTKKCYTKAWGIPSEIEEDNWIEIQKYPQPELPAPSDICNDWLDSEQLLNIDSQPKLSELIELEAITEDTDGKNVIHYETKKLIEYPEIEKAWKKYIDEEWLPWSERYALWLKVHKVYSELFNIHQKQLREGEEYELFLGIGLLKWKAPNGQIAHRHLVVGKASIEFEAAKGRFTVRPAVSGADVHVEIDMIDQGHQPPNIKQLEQDGLEGTNNNLWDRSSIDPLISAITNSLANDGRGDYFPDLIQPSSRLISEIPIVEYAPALFLRKRSIRNLVSTLEDIKKQVENGLAIPNAFLELCEIHLEKLTLPENSIIEPDGDIYFPFAANDAQLKIIDALKNNTGVLVQGPPGTGKSHTIANLICHLLATGKKILVTAKTSRALQVLQEKLPPEMQPLGISLLGQGKEEKDSLEKSINGILHKKSQWSVLEDQTKIRIDELQSKIYQLKKDKAENHNKLGQLREKETYLHSIANGIYRGTAEKIAKKLQNDDATYSSWLKDHISETQNLPLSVDELHELGSELEAINIDQEAELNFYIPQPDTELPAIDVLAELFSKEQQLSQAVEKVSTNLYEVIKSTEIENVYKLNSSIKLLFETENQINQNHRLWVKNAISDVLSDSNISLTELLLLSKRKIQGLKDQASNVDDIGVKIPENVDRKKLFNDVLALKNHFESGGKLKKLGFKTEFAKNHKDLLERVTLDGEKCNTLALSEKLIDYLNVELSLESLWSLWSGKAEPTQQFKLLQIAEIQDLNITLEAILKLVDVHQEAKVSIRAIDSLGMPDWDNKQSLHDILLACKFAVSNFELLEIKTKIDICRNRVLFLLNKNCHVSVSKLYDTVLNRDINGYCLYYAELEELSRLKAILNNRTEKLERLKTHVPILINNIINSSEKRIWSEKIIGLEKGWAWAQAKTWLDKFLNNDLTSLEAESIRLEESVKQHTSDIAAEKAWFYCCTRLDDKTKRDLVSWRQAMDKYGNGNGKYASFYLQAAQSHFQQCVDAIPVWIMPVHRVYETVKAAPSIFDVIIIDEASQCGFEALPLLYLGNNIIVVGDDKQIAPEAVGMNQQPVINLQNSLLGNFQFRTAFGITDSLFAHADRLFRSTLSLQEHFRCVPEIIRFSNDLCYQSKLIPLRQYPPKRLDPIKNTYVPNGFREGNDSKVINKPEAEILVDTLVECCENDEYKNKSMGVITLQGAAQAFLIESLLLEKLGAKEIEKRRIICGNPYSFQGDERDVIFLSMVVDDKRRNGTLSDKYDERRFNVAASRAKDQMWLFHSVTINSLGQTCLRRRLLDYFINPVSMINNALGDAEQLRELAHTVNREEQKPPAPYDSWFEVDVILRIAAKGYRVLPQFKFAGKKIDMVVEGGISRLAVECDGDYWHGAAQYDDDMARQRMLERSEWNFFRIRSCEFYANPEKLLVRLWKELDYRGIKPVIGLSSNDNDEEVLEGLLVNRDFELSETQEEIKDSGDEPQKNTIEIARQVAPTTRMTAQDALALRPAELRELIIDVLEERPNNSCMKNRLATEVLKKCEIITRGNPRLNFEHKVLGAIKYMDTQGYVKIYHTGVNERIKLGAITLPRQTHLLQ